MAFSNDTNGNLVHLRTNNQKIIYVTWTTVPTDATDGYAKGCLYVDTDVTSGTSGLYVNVWTDSSCIFKLVSNAA